MRQKIKSNIGWYLSKAIYDWNPFKERRKKKFYSQFISKGDLCYDVGAHLGDRTRCWLGLGAHVLAIEPQPRFANHLKTKFGAKDRFSFEQIGVGEEQGNLRMKISTMYPTLSTLSGQQWVNDLKDAAPMAIDFDQEIEVKVKTLDDLIEEYGKPTFCKIDVEGFEEQVLNGMNDPIPVVSFEFLSFNEKALTACLKRLQDLGYTQFNWSYQESFSWKMQNWSSIERVADSIRNFKNGTYSGDVYARI